MDDDLIEGNWNQLKAKIKQHWNKLTDDQLKNILGSRIKLAGKIQDAYGCSLEEAERQIADWEKKYKDANDDSLL
jgi:uncharacterized protein YjbJ (UPF0337 family)